MPEEKPLGWHPGPADDRDRPLVATVERKMAEQKAKEYGSKFWYSPSTLKQWEGSCVGHGGIHVYNSSPKVHRLTDNDAMTVYKLAQRKYDPWPGEDYEGTSVRAGAMAMVELGYWEAFALAYGTQDKAITLPQLARHILNVGPVMFGINWREGYDQPTADNNYFIKAEGQNRGGHNVALDGVRFTGNPDRDYVRGHQTWGHEIGFRAYRVGGFFRIAWRLMEEIMEDDMTTACSPVEKRAA